MKYQSFVINIINLFGLYISDSQIRSTTEKGPKYRFPVQIDLQKCRKNAGSLNELCRRWCKREHVECDALKDWKLNIFKIKDRRISFSKYYFVIT